LNCLAITYFCLKYKEIARFRFSIVLINDNRISNKALIVLVNDNNAFVLVYNCNLIKLDNNLILKFLIAISFFNCVKIFVFFSCFLISLLIIALFDKFMLFCRIYIRLIASNRLIDSNLGDSSQFDLKVLTNRFLKLKSKLDSKNRLESSKDKVI